MESGWDTRGGGLEGGGAPQRAGQPRRSQCRGLGTWGHHVPSFVSWPLSQLSTVGACLGLCQCQPGRERTQHASYRKPGPLALGASQLCAAGTNRPTQSSPSAPRTPGTETACSWDFNSELKAHLSLASLWLNNNARDFWGLPTFLQPLLSPLPWTMDVLL